MKFIEVKKGVSVRKDQIIALEEVGKLSCKIILESGEYTINFPYESMKKILDSPDNGTSLGSIPEFRDGQHWRG